MARRRRLRRAARGAGRVRAVSRCTGEDGGGGRGPTTPDARRTRRDETEKKCLQYEETKRVCFTRTRARARLTGTRSHAPTATPPGGLQPPRPNTSTRSTGPVLARPPQHLQVASPRRSPARLLVPLAPFSRAHRNTSRWPLAAASSHVPESHGHPFRRAHRNTSRWPSIAAQSHVCCPTGTRAARPLQHLQVASLRRVRARQLVPRAPVLTRPLKHIQVASPPRSRTSPRPTGTRSHAPTAASPGGLPAPRSSTCTRSTGTRSRAPTAASPGDLRSPPPRTSPSPTDTRVGAATEAPPGGLPARACTRARPTGTRSDAPTGALPDALPPRRPSTCVRPTGTRSDAPTRAPPGALLRRVRARAHGNLYPLAHKNARMAICRARRPTKSSPP